MLGAIIGDMVGSVYEFNNIKTKDFPLLEKGFFTDDTVMTLAVCDILQNKQAHNRDYVIDKLKAWGRAYPNAGYGGRFYNWIMSEDRQPYNSCGNGAAMRVSACGWYGRDEYEVKQLSRLVTEVTHNHPEGIKGAEVTAMCVYYARIGKSKEFIKKYVENYYVLDFNYDNLVKTYKHEAEICQCTVPQAIYCFLISNSFEDCLRTTISIGGDCDTTAAISCAIAEAYYKYIDIKLVNWALDRLPKEFNSCTVPDAKEILIKYIGYSSALGLFDENSNEKSLCLKQTLKINDLIYTLSYKSRFASAFGRLIVYSIIPSIIEEIINNDKMLDCSLLVENKIYEWFDIIFKNNNLEENKIKTLRTLRFTSNALLNELTFGKLKIYIDLLKNIIYRYNLPTTLEYEFV